MNNNFLNHVLKSDIKDLIKNVDNLTIKKGEISGNSIEIEDSVTQSQSSYVYYSRTDDRDKDFNELLNLIAESKNEQ